MNNHNEAEIAGYRDALNEITPETMEQLELAYLEARDDANINQLLLIPCVILDFLCIHPFRELKETGELIGDTGINEVEGSPNEIEIGYNASIRVLEKNGYEFVKEEFGAEDNPYGNGMLIYKKQY